MENKDIPKEIWISEDTAKRLLPSNAISVGLKHLYNDDTKYIHISEVERLYKYEELYNKTIAEIEDLEIRIQSLEIKTKEEMKAGNPDPKTYDDIMGWMMEREDCKSKLELLKYLIK